MGRNRSSAVPAVGGQPEDVAAQDADGAVAGQFDYGRAGRWCRRGLA